MTHFDVIVIGAGPSGLACCSFLKTESVLLLDKNEQIGGKIKVSGGGRCNITNLKPNDLFIKNVVHNPKFLYSTLAKFGPNEIFDFCEEHKLPLKIERNDRVFPQSDQSNHVISMFNNILRQKNVQVELEYEVDEVAQIDGKYVVNRQYSCDKLVIATGGKTYPQLGTTGDGYEFAKSFDHTVTPLYAVESPLVSTDEIIQNRTLQGVSLHNATATLYAGNKKLYTNSNDILFTHFGLSGPLAISMSYFFVKERNQKNRPMKLVIDINNQEMVPKRIKPFINEDGQIEINICDVKGFKTGFVTYGGISLKEVNPSSFESKLHENLFFIGEILDINALTGGYNITICLSEGYSCASAINERM